jgi:pSer/pThr/pTyr-binding forkhead associated (FHA) protein
VINAPIPEIPLTPENAALRMKSRDKLFHLDRMRLVVGRSVPPAIAVDIDLGDYDTTIPPVVSRRHAQLQWVNGELQIIDLGSRNGTFVDGNRLSPQIPGQPLAAVILKRGAKIKFGSLELDLVRK